MTLLTVELCAYGLDRDMCFNGTISTKFCGKQIHEIEPRTEFS